MAFRAAFYKGTRPGFSAIYSIGVRWWTKSPYSHCELVFSDGACGSSSFMDGGVRLKHINFNPDHWDFIDLDPSYEGQARAYIELNLGVKYDILGNVGFLLGPIYDSANRLFCSEVLVAALGVPRPELYHPGLAHSVIKYKFAEFT